MLPLVLNYKLLTYIRHSMCVIILFIWVKSKNTHFIHFWHLTTWGLNSKISFCGNIIIEYTLHLKSVRIDSNTLYAPINSKLQLTFPPPLPPAYPGHLTVYRTQGGGNLNVALEGNLNRIYLSMLWRNTPMSFFSVFAGFDWFTRWNFAFASE